MLGATFNLLDIIMEGLSPLKKLFDAIRLIWRLPSFSVSKFTVVIKRITRLKNASNMADPICREGSDRCLNNKIYILHTTVGVIPTDIGKKYIDK